MNKDKGIYFILKLMEHSGVLSSGFDIFDVLSSNIESVIDIIGWFRTNFGKKPFQSIKLMSHSIIYEFTIYLSEIRDPPD